MSDSPAHAGAPSGAPTDDARLDARRALADRVGALPSMHPDYVVAWMHCYGAGMEPATVELERDGELVAVMPLVDRGSDGLTGMPEAEDYALVAPDRATADALADAALDRHSERFVLAPVAAESVTAAALTAAAERASRPVSERVVAERPMVDTSGDWEGYWADRNGKHRGEVRRLRRRLDDLGAVELDPGSEIGDLDQRLEQFVALEATGWKGEAGSALAQRDRERAFFEALARWAAGKGWLRMPTLTLDGRPIAIQLNIEAHGVKYGLKMAYERELRKFAPGMLLLCSEIERAFGDPEIDWYDLEGDMSEPYKARWATDGRTYLELSIFPSGAVGRAAWLAQSRLRPALGRARRAVAGSGDD